MVEILWTALRDFLHAGGWVLWLIFVLSVLLWGLLADRFLFLHFQKPQLTRSLAERWQMRQDRSSWAAAQILRGYVGRARSELYRNLLTIKTLVAVCPLLGLLGTITGMIAVFETMAVTGTGNARMMAAGISMATIPTMAGMVVALSAIFVIARLESKLVKAMQEISSQIEGEI